MRNAIIQVTVASLFLASCAKQPATVTASDTTRPPEINERFRIVDPPPPPLPPDTNTPRTTTLRTDTTAPTVLPGQDRPIVRLDPNGVRVVTELADIHFDFDRHDLRQDAIRILDRSAAWLREHPRELVLVEGHCDQRGTDEYNLALGERRAKTAMNYLVSQGIAASRLSLVSYGEERPACAERTEACWTRNRRARFLAKAG